ncbi:hypothetical protein IWW55_004478 [Coemansia sp. RSA 2706]|nr:hypothetical protein IWW55_004478 [Coemansia sp. RSA 2706]KAJ2326602.1 hypothetical protein IWW51_002187 [Coemansia sp. RSA 2702]
MAPVTRRQSRRLSEAAVPAPQASTAASNPLASGSGRIAKPERKGRVVASRYMSAAPKARSTDTPTATPKPAASRAKSGAAAGPVSRPASRQAGVTATRPRPAAGSRAPAVTRRAPTATANPPASTRKPAPKKEPAASKTAADSTVDARLERRASRRTTVAPSGSAIDGTSSSHADQYTEYLRWQLLEARSQAAFDAAKSAAGSELSRLADEAELAKRELLEEQRKLKLVRELAALSGWLAGNRRYLEGMGEQIDSVRQPYTQLSRSLAHTTRAMPISGVHFSDAPSLVRELDGFRDAIARCFPGDAPGVQDMYAVAAKLNRFYQAQRQEHELLCECKRLKESLEQTTALAISRGAANPS